MRFRIPVFAALAVAVALALAGPASAQVLFGQAGPNFKNLVDNSNFNVYQRGTTAVTTITTTATYHADRWAGYSGTSTNETLTNVTSSLPTGTGTPVFTNAEQVQRASGQTGVAATCLIQEIPTSDIKPLAGQPVTLSFWALAGSNFSATSSLLTAQVATGTGTDQGLASFISGWTGAATPVSYGATLTTNWQRFAVTGTLAATVTEAAVNICFTPTGTAGTNDYFQITGVQLEQGTIATNLEWRPAGVELTKLNRYFWEVNEAVSGVTTFGVCQAVSTTSGRCVIPNPVLMRAAPTAACTVGTLAVNVAGTATALTACAATSGGSGIGAIELTTTVASGQTAGQVEVLQSGNSTGGGVISASADF